MPPTLNIFLSYAHEDNDMKIQLDRSLVMLKRSGKINVWSDVEIQPGFEWNESISNALATADIILLLISVDFNNSQYIWDKELKIALERHERREARVIPIILRTCEWS